MFAKYQICHFVNHNKTLHF